MMSRPGSVCAIIAALAFASALPPPIAKPLITRVAADLLHAWYYWCSMLLGAAPYLAAGGLAAAIARSLQADHRALPAFAMLFPGCDCAMNAYAATLTRARPSLAAFTVVWGNCCNPLALLSTLVILGPRMLGCRLGAGLAAAVLTAVAWSRLPPQSLPIPCARTQSFSENFVRFMGAGVASFSIAAAVSAVCLVLLSQAADRPAGPLFAALLGAVLSPCSSADALLARVLFHSPVSQLAFIVAAQCLDVRQIALLKSTFGAGRTVGALGAAALACVVGSFFAAR